MIDDILVFDDLFTQEETNKIEGLFLSQRLPWVYFPTMASGKDHPGAKQKKPTPGWGCYIKQESPWYVNQPLFEDVRFIIDKATDKIGRKWKYLLNARSFMMFPLSDKFEVDHQGIHVDAKVPHLVCLYYVNDSDGDTHIFDYMYDGTLNRTDIEWNVLKRVTPKKGRVLLFNGFRYHSSSSPKENVRCIINFDLVI